MSFVYVSNAEDGTVGCYRLDAGGALEPGARASTGGGRPGPMSVSPDRRFLFVALREKPFTAVSFAIERKTGALKEAGRGALAESLPYILADQTGRWLLGASYSADLVSVNPIGKDGKVGDPQQVIPTARHAHCIVTDNTNRWVFVPHLGTDQVFQFQFDAKSGKLTANTPATVQIKQGAGPRHLIISRDNKFAYLLNELTAVVSTLALDAKTGLLTQVSEASALAAGSTLKPGAPRPSPGRDVSGDVWASDLHLTPDGRFLYAAERTSSTLNGFSVDGATGKLTLLGATPTEKQPRGFRIDPAGKFMVVTGELSQTISVYAIGADGALKLLGRYPTGKGSNWVEIVDLR